MERYLMLPSLEIRLLGPLDVRLQGIPLPRLRSRKSVELLGLLCLRSGQELSRSWLAGMLWPESAEAEALHGLRQCVADLRKAFGAEAGRLQSPNMRSLCLDLTGIQTDLQAFDQAVQAGAFAVAVALYHGPLLEGIVAEWVEEERAPRRDAFFLALEQSACSAAEQKEYPTAISLLRRLTALDPLRESGYRELMRCLAASGSPAAAITVYRELRLRLHHDIQSEPDAATTALFQQIRRTAHEVSETTGSQRIPVPQISSTLPTPLTPLRGREEELQETLRYLRTARLGTLVGPGGIGKTRLALEVAQRLAAEGSAFPDGVWFIDLTVLVPGDTLMELEQVIAKVLFTGKLPEGLSSREMILEWLRHRTCLFILDNAEHVLTKVTPLVRALLERAPGLRILCTSRQALGITGEQLIPIPPLTAEDAVALFTERAAATNPHFDREPQAITAICTHLDGMPLAIELAAARVSLLAPQQIAERLKDRFRLLESEDTSAPLRQRTLRGTLEWSWDLLSKEEQALLARLSVFVGSWTLEAGEAVGEASDTLLGRLVAKSLVVRESVPIQITYLRPHLSPHSIGTQTRYRLLETIREFAAEQLSLEGREAAQRRHLHFFRDLAEALPPPRPFCPFPADALARLLLEWQNIRAALAFSEQLGAWEANIRILTALWFPLIAWRYTFDEELPTLQRRIDSAESSPGAIQPLWLGHALICLSRWQHYKGMEAQALQTAQRALELGQSHSLLEIQAEAYFQRETISSTPMRAELEACLQLYRNLNQPLRRIEALHRAIELLATKEPQAALAFLKEMQECVQASPTPLLQFHLLYTTHFLHYLQGRPEQAVPYLEQAAALGRDEPSVAPTLRDTLYAYGHTLRTIGAFPKALSVLEEAWQLPDHERPLWFEIRLVLMLSRTAIDCNNPGLAEQRMEEAKRLIQHTNGLMYVFLESLIQDVGLRLALRQNLLSDVLFEAERSLKAKRDRQRSGIEMPPFHFHPALFAIAAARTRLGDWETASQLWGYLINHNEIPIPSRTSLFGSDLDKDIETLNRALQSDPVLSTVWEAGSQLTLEEAINLATPPPSPAREL